MSTCFKLVLSSCNIHSKEEKLLVVALRDCGLSSESIAKQTGVSKSNVEKWVSEKVTFLRHNTNTLTQSSSIGTSTCNREISRLVGIRRLLVREHKLLGGRRCQTRGTHQTSRAARSRNHAHHTATCRTT